MLKYEIMMILKLKTKNYESIQNKYTMPLT